MRYRAAVLIELVLQLADAPAAVGRAFRAVAHDDAGLIGPDRFRCAPFSAPAAQRRPYSIALAIRTPCYSHRSECSAAEVKNVRRLLLHHVVYFCSMSAQFDAVDTTGDRRIDFTEFVDGVAVIDTGLSAVAARAEFSRLANGGSFVLFEDFCSW